MPKKAREVPERDVEYILKAIPGTQVKMPHRKSRHRLAPEKRPFIFPADQVQDVAHALKLGMNVALTGPTGCGKTALPRAICAELGEPLIRFNCDGETRVSNLRGMNIPAAKDGVLTLKFSPGDLAICMAEGYKVLLDEIDAALPSVRFVLQPVLEEDNRTLHIPETGETIVAQKGFAVFATGNTIGYRAVARAQHAGTTPINAAFLDRFGMVLACDYPSREDEFKRVKINVPHCDDDIVDGICRSAEELRADEKFKSDFSTRRCIQWARLVSEYGFKGVLHTSELAVVRKFEFATDAKVAREVIARIFGYEDGDGS